MDDKVYSYLAEWTVNFVKNKDIISRKIESVEKGKDGFDLYVKYKDREQYFMIIPAIDGIDMLVRKITNDAHLTIVVLNSQKNLEIVIKNWLKLVSFRFLSIIFVNPFSDFDKKWIIFPHTHHRICDESSLESGLKSMFSMVEPINEEQLATIITG